MMDNQWWLTFLNYIEPYVDQLTIADAFGGFILTVISVLVTLLIAYIRWKALLKKLRKLSLEITKTEQEVLMLDLREANTAISDRRAEIETNITLLALKNSRIAELETKLEIDKATKRRIDQLRPRHTREIDEAKSQIGVLEDDQEFLIKILNGAMRERGKVTGKLREHQKNRDATADA